jgi:transposase
VAHKALSAARSQSVTLPAQEVASGIVAELAAEILALKERIESIDKELEKRFFARPEARILTSLPGHGSDPRSRVLGGRGRYFRLL